MSNNGPELLKAPLTLPSTVDALATLPTLSPSKDTVTEPPRRDFGDYELLEELGRGGMGVVYKARQKGLNRTIALKMILPGAGIHEDEIQRFRTEAEAAARLQHPNIVAVHGVGEVEGQHFYSMEYINGPSLAARLAQGPLPGPAAARYIMILARALHYAHGHGILHRDLKPSNVLLDRDDQPHLTDFGLAKKLGDSSLTQTGHILGTPSYMAPEQAAGRIKELGPAADVYGLGAVLYELLTGKPVFRAESPLDTIQQVLEQDPIPPRELNPELDKDVETICLKCLQKDPRQRYASAAELADDLNRYLSGDSIQARSFSVLDRLVWEVDRSRIDVSFRSWAKILVRFAWIMLAGHAAMFFVLLLNEHSSAWRLHWTVRLTQFGLMAWVFLSFRTRAVSATKASGQSRWERCADYMRALFPTNAGERQLWAIWDGYLMGYVITVLVIGELARRDGFNWDELAIYPFSAVLAGLAFFAMGSSYWGRCYIVGLSFFGGAAVMPVWLPGAPLLLGVIWFGWLLCIAHHLRHHDKPPEA